MTNATMRAITKPSGRIGLVLKDAPIPQVGPADVRVRLLATSICGSDLHIYDNDPTFLGRVKDGNISGHELCGVVDAVGPLCARVKVGDVVALESHIICGVCWYCRNGKSHLCANTVTIGIDRDGGFTDYIVLPEDNAILKPDSISVEEAALLEPFGNALDTATCVDVVGKCVLVTGCGPQGVMAIAIAKAAGARRVIATEIHQRRREMAVSMMKLHAAAHRRDEDLVLDPRKPDTEAVIREATDGLGVDVVLEMSGNPNAINTAFATLRSGGDYVALGLAGQNVSIDWTHHVVVRGITIHGIYGRHVYQTWDKARALLDSGAVTLAPLITHRFGLEEYEKAFQLLKAGEAEKVVLYPDKAR
jgi:threonine 3-dehydrogenase